jgi:hypothetical protein
VTPASKQRYEEIEKELSLLKIKVQDLRKITKRKR